MIDESAAVLPIWMLISAAFGFIIGEASGRSFGHRKCLEQVNEDLRKELDKTRAREGSVQHELKRQHSVLCDIHKRLSAVQKGLEKPAA